LGARELLYFFVWRDIKVRYKQTAIGAAWAVLQPFMTMVVFSLFFGKLARMPSHGLPYPVFYYSALLPWTYFAGALQLATNVVVDQQHVITKVYFPRLVLPLSAVTSGLLDFAISFWCSSESCSVSHPAHACAAGVSFLPDSRGRYRARRGTVAIGAERDLPDVRYVVPFLVQFWLFASPVAYPSSIVPERWRWLYGLNPMAGVIEGFRWSLTGTGEAPTLLLAASSGAVLLLLVAGCFFFRGWKERLRMCVGDERGRHSGGKSGQTLSDWRAAPDHGAAACAGQRPRRAGQNLPFAPAKTVERRCDPYLGAAGCIV